MTATTSTTTTDAARDEAFESIRTALEDVRKGWRFAYAKVAAVLVDKDRATKGHYTARQYAEWAKVSHETVRGWLIVAPLAALLESKGIRPLSTEATGLHGRINTAKARGVSFDALVALTEDARKALAKVAKGDDEAARKVIADWSDAVKAAKDAAVQAKKDADLSGRGDEGGTPDVPPAPPTDEEAYAAAEAVAMQGLSAMVSLVQSGKVTPGTGTVALGAAMRVIADAYNAKVRADREAKDAASVPTPATLPRKRTRKAPAA